ncbi:MAG: hypothetical protein HYV14_02390 [Elusimicrobia bacterium]|nr:hypothetical protein [Elusimicrobiota bacterium]
MISRILLASLFAGPAYAAAPETAPAAAAEASQRLFARCSKADFGVDELLADAALRSDLATCSSAEIRDLLDYAACRDLQGAPGGCAALGGIRGWGAQSVAGCRDTALDDRFIFQTLRNGDALGACRDLFKLDGKSGPAVDRGCAAVIAAVRSGNAASSCAALARERLLEAGERCEDHMIRWAGVPADCGRISDADARHLCRGRASLAAGARSPAQCAASPSCQALAARSPKACDGLKARFTRSLCARVAAEAKGLARGQELRSQAEAEAKAKAAKEAAAQAAAEAARRAKAEAAIASLKAEADSAASRAATDLARAKAESEEKAAKLAAAESAKHAKNAEAVKARAEAEARKALAAELKVRSQPKPQFKKGEPMQAQSPEVTEMLKALQEGRPIPKPAPKPKKAVPAEDAPSAR